MKASYSVGSISVLKFLLVLSPNCSNKFLTVVLSANAKAGRAGACTAVLSLVHSTDGAFLNETEAWTGTQNTQTTTARSTQQDGSSALTYTYINNCSVKIDPNTQGITLYELFVTVDYTPAGYGNTVNGVAAANIGKVNGVATASISKVNGI